MERFDDCFEATNSNGKRKRHDQWRLKVDRSSVVGLDDDAGNDFIYDRDKYVYGVVRVMKQAVQWFDHHPIEICIVDDWRFE